MSKKYIIIHANGEPFENVRDKDGELGDAATQITKQLTEEELGGICVCLCITDYESHSYMFITKGSKNVDADRIANKYSGEDAVGTYKYVLECENARDLAVTAKFDSFNFIKGFLYAAHIIGFSTYKITIKPT